MLRGLTFILGKSKTCHKEVYPKNWTAEAYPGKDAATGSKPPGQQVLTLICRPSWQMRRFGSLCAMDIFSAAKGRVLRSFISRSVPVIGEKPKNLKPAFVLVCAHLVWSAGNLLWSAANLMWPAANLMWSAANVVWSTANLVSVSYTHLRAHET